MTEEHSAAGSYLRGCDEYISDRTYSMKSNDDHHLIRKPGAGAGEEGEHEGEEQDEKEQRGVQVIVSASF